MPFYTGIMAVLCVGPLFLAQESETSLYIRSLKAYAKADREAQTGGTLIVVKNIVVNDSAFFYPSPSRVDTIPVEYMDARALHAKYRDNGKAFRAVEIKPMINQNDELIVDCTKYLVTLRKSKVILGVIGASQFTGTSTRQAVVTNWFAWHPGVHGCSLTTLYGVVK
jgi:hypothetical protein